MQLDRTFIKIRERNTFEIADISLKVFKRYFWGLLAASSVFVLPMALINFAVLYPLLDNRFIDQPFAHFWYMTCLIIIQSSFATATVSQLLGSTLFEGKTNAWQAIGITCKNLHRLLWLHLMRRMFGWTAVVAWFIWSDPYSGPLTLMFFTVLVVIVELVIRSIRPFGNEILLLERVSIGGGNKRTTNDHVPVTYKMRTRSLHADASNMLISRSFVVGFAACVIGASFYFLLIQKAVFDNQWHPTQWWTIIMYPTAFWLCAIYLAVVRFLSYIDLRTRQEGWDIELRIRAEANRLKSKMSVAHQEHIEGLA